MFIKNLVIEKMNKDDPRYPEKDAVKRADGSWVPFLEVYRCEITIDGEEKFETAFYATKNMNFDYAGNMLRVMADSITDMKMPKVAWINPLLKKSAGELCAMWQSRALRVSTGKMQRVLMVVLSYEYAAAMPVLLRATFQGFTDIERPFLSSYATIMPSGRVVCEMIDSDGTKKQVAIYESEEKFTTDMRDLADKLKLSDTERAEMFKVLARWIVKDMRIGLHGERLAP